MNTNIDYKYNQIGGDIIIMNPEKSITIKNFLQKKYEKITINKDTIIIPNLKINIIFKKNLDNSYTFTFPPICYFVKYDGSMGNTINVNSVHFSSFELHLKSILINNYIKVDNILYMYQPSPEELDKIYKYHSN